MNPDVRLRDALRALCQATEAMADAMVKTDVPDMRAAGRHALRASEDARASIHDHETARP